MKPFKINLLVLLLGLSMAAHSQVEVPKDEAPIFEKVEIEASYPGGEAAWRKYLEKNLNAMTPINNSAPSGYYQIWIQFIVDRDGNLADIKALTNLGYGMEAEVIRILRKSGKWKPAEQGGRLVKAYRKQPVTFMVTDDGFDIKTQTPHILFIGIENTVTVDVPKVKDEDLQLTISQGTVVRNANGGFTAKVTRVGRAIIEIYNKKKNKKVGAASFEVKLLENPASAKEDKNN